MRALATSLALLSCVQCQAETVSATFKGIADIEVQQFVSGQQIGPTATYQAVPSTLSFSITADTNPGHGPFQFSLSNSVYSLNSATLPLISLSDLIYLNTFVIDGVPGQSRDLVSAGMQSSVYHDWWLQAGITLTDPTGEYIGPNGNGDSSNVLVTAEYVYQPWDSTDTGKTYTVSFTTDPPSDPPAATPEPSSIVMMAIGLIAVIWRSR